MYGIVTACLDSFSSLQSQFSIGTVVRFEPSERKRVRLVALAGERMVYGGNGLINGKLDDAERKRQALEK